MNNLNQCTEEGDSSETEKQVSENSAEERETQSKRSGSFSRSDSNSSEDDTNSENKSRGEPQRKRRDTGSDGDDDNHLTERISLPSEEPREPLPDPSVVMSPDEYLLKLVKAMYGLDLEVKAALSMKAFFCDVTDEQVAAYNMKVVGAVRNNDVNALKQLHEEGQALNCFNRFGESLLNMSCRRGFADIVSYLLQQPDIDVRIRDDSGRTPLHDACWNPKPQLEICKGLIERDPALLLIADKRGHTAFQYARREDWGTWCKFLHENRQSLKPLSDTGMVKLLSRT